jgi:acetylornithine deacetylase/succinyl-diaminopimelate desuccinylase-like protein
MATMIHGPMAIDPKHAFVQAAQKAMRDFELPSDDLTVFPAWTDGALLSREAKIPSIIWGPGDLKLAHTPEESIKLEDVSTAAELYAAASLYFTRSI